MSTVAGMAARSDPYAMLDGPDERRRPWVAFVVPMVVLAVLIGLLTYVAVSGGDDDRLPQAPAAPNVPGTP